MEDSQEEGESNPMTKWERKWKCAVCDEHVVFNDEKHTFTCGCGTIHDHDIPANVLLRYYQVTLLTETY